MNKELIKKYKAEFNHWLNGGELLYSYIDDKFLWKSMDEIDKNMYPVYIRNPFQLSEHHIIIINDEFVEFRKALAEGKVVQEQDYYSKQWFDMKTPDFHEASDTQYEGVYRIKPEEPKFKVGDWVVEIHSTTKAQVLELFGNQIRVKLCYPDAIITTDSSDFIPWIPKKGDWCWFLNKSRIPVISQFHSLEIEGNRKYSATFPNTPHPMIGYYDYCEPFIGNLPTTLQK